MRFDRWGWLALVAMILGLSACRELYEPLGAESVEELPYRIRLVDAEGRPWADRSVRISNLEFSLSFVGWTDEEGEVQFAAGELDTVFLTLEVDDPLGQRAEIVEPVEVPSPGVSRIVFDPRFREHAVHVPVSLRAGPYGSRIQVRHWLGARSPVLIHIIPVAAGGRYFLPASLERWPISQVDVLLRPVGGGSLSFDLDPEKLTDTPEWNLDLRPVRLGLMSGGMPLDGTVNIGLEDLTSPDRTSVRWSGQTVVAGRVEAWGPRTLDRLRVEPAGDALFDFSAILPDADADSVQVELGEHEVQVVVQGLEGGPGIGLQVDLTFGGSLLRRKSGPDGRVRVRCNTGSLELKLDPGRSFSPWAEGNVWIRADTTLVFFVGEPR